MHLSTWLLIVVCCWIQSISWKQPFSIKPKLSNIRLSAQGFGKSPSNDKHKLKTIDYLVTPTRPGQRHETTGAFANLLSRQCEIFEKMRDKLPYKSYSIADMYCRAINTQQYYFIGKISYNLPTKDFSKSVHRAIRCLEPLLIEYAKSLRKELAAPTVQGLQLWYTEGNSELQVAQHLIPLLPYKINQVDCGNDETICEAIKSFSDVGYEPEIYKKDEKGFVCERDDQGRCIKAPIKVNFQDPSFLQNLEQK